MKLIAILKIAIQITRNYKQIVPEMNELYAGYKEARADGDVSLAETRLIIEDLFDVLSLLLPAFSEFRALLVSSNPKK
jgi:hypothetical protein